MQNTKSAHVCTAGRIKTFIQSSGSVDLLPEENSNRRFWVVDRLAPSEIPPPSALNFDEVLMPEIAGVADMDGPRDTANTLWVGTQRNHIHLTRHCTDYELEHFPERIPYWAAHLTRHDESDRKWRRTALCVVDDFGWLVEVPTC